MIGMKVTGFPRLGLTLLAVRSACTQIEVPHITYIARAIIAGIDRADSTTIWANQFIAGSAIHESRLISPNRLPARNLLEQIVCPGSMLHRPRFVFVDLPSAEISTAWSITDSANALAIGAPKIFTVPIAKMIGMCPRLTFGGLEVDLNRTGGFSKLLDLA